jgi:hypothetical protein
VDILIFGPKREPSHGILDSPRSCLRCFENKQSKEKLYNLFAKKEEYFWCSKLENYMD